MKLCLSKWALLLGTPIVLMGYQNCAKLGTDNLLGGSSGFVGSGSGSTEIASSSEPSPSTDPMVKSADLLTQALKACRAPASLSAPVANLNLDINHESIKVDAYQVTGIQGYKGNYVLVRGVSGGALTVGSVDVNQTTLVLCGFKSVDSIKGAKNKIIVIAPDGGVTQVGEVTGRSDFYFVNASAQKVTGNSSKIGYYSPN